MKNGLFGVLCHVTSLKNKYGIGDFGKSSFEFVDYLSNQSVDIWQILPLSETNRYNCPYGSCCSFAMDSRFMDLDELVKQKLLNKNDLKPLIRNNKCEKVNYSFVVKEKNRLIDLAYSRMTNAQKQHLAEYASSHKVFYEYAYFRTLLEVFDLYDWRKLPKEYICASNATKKAFINKHQDTFLKYIFIQKSLYEQWHKVKEYANSKGIKIFGDLPIYCEPYAFDIFYMPNYYLLDKDYNALAYGGVLGDDFNDYGQNWGTCVYNWSKIEKENFKFFVDKISRILSLYDVVRLDHYNGYCDHFEVDVNSEGRVRGKWVEAGGTKLFTVLKNKFGLDKFVIEDLGNNRPASAKVKKEFNLVGMSILQFAHDKDSTYLPTNVDNNCIYYLGTHDNNTFVGFLDSLSDKDKLDFCTLVGVDGKNNSEIAIECMKKILNTKTKYKIFAIQDLLLQDERYRMNVPGQADFCWDYKVPNNYKARMSKVLKQIR